MSNTNTNTNTNTITFDTDDRFPIGTTFTPLGKQPWREHTVIGYVVTHDTSTGATKVDYHTTYEFCGQLVKDVCGHTTIARALHAAGLPWTVES